jgi:hypothetical protein
LITRWRAIGCAADGAKDFLHRRGMAEDLGRQRRRVAIADFRRGLLDGAAHQRHRLVDVEGLGQVFERAALESGDRGIEV